MYKIDIPKEVRSPELLSLRYPDCASAFLFAISEIRKYNPFIEKKMATAQGLQATKDSNGARGTIAISWPKAGGGSGKIHWGSLPYIKVDIYRNVVKIIKFNCPKRFYISPRSFDPRLGYQVSEEFIERQKDFKMEENEFSDSEYVIVDWPLQHPGKQLAFIFAYHVIPPSKIAEKTGCPIDDVVKILEGDVVPDDSFIDRLEGLLSVEVVDHMKSYVVDFRDQENSPDFNLR